MNPVYLVVLAFLAAMLGLLVDPFWLWLSALAGLAWLTGFIRWLGH